MTTSPNPAPMTADDLLRLPDDGYHRYELSQGMLIVMSPASYLSGRVASWLGKRLAIFIDDHDLGIYSGADGGMLLEQDPDTMRAPDFSFVRKERAAAGAKPGFFPGAPDLAIEVLSPSDKFAEVSRKVQEYLRAGTRLVWVIEPDARSVVIYRPERAPLILGPDGILDGEDVLPGFILQLAELWSYIDGV